MKVVHICLNGPVTDGWNYQDNLLTKYHKKNGYEVTMITSQWIWKSDGRLGKCEDTNYINADGVKMIRLPIIGRDEHSRKFKKYLGLAEQIEYEKPDILFVHGVSFLDSRLVAKYCKANKNVVLYVDNHADFSNSGTNWLSRNILHKIIWRLCAKNLLPYTRKFYGVLPARVDWLVNIYGLPREKCELLLMGADDDRVRAADSAEVREGVRQKHGIAKDEFLIMSGGKIDAQKRQTLLLMEAVSKIANPKVKLLIFGSVSSDLKEEFEKRCLKDKIIYAGWIDPNLSYSYVAASELMVFPGRHSVFWEQVCGQGKPMLVKYWKGATHIDLGGNVEFLYRESAREIYEKLVEILENTQKYRKMKAVAESRGREIFSYNEIAKRSLETGMRR